MISINNFRISPEATFVGDGAGPHIGYDRAAEISQRAQRDGCSLKEAALALGYVTQEDYERWVVAAKMVRPPSN